VLSRTLSFEISVDDRDCGAYAARHLSRGISLITERDGVCVFHVGHKIDPHAVSVQWLPETKVRAIVKQARRDAGASPDAATAGRALAQAAADQRVTLTPHHVAMTRAGDAANRIEQHMEFLRRTGKDFPLRNRRDRLPLGARFCV
jgi:hypothetical protein